MKFQLNRLPAKRACLIGPSGLNSIRSCSNYHSSYRERFFLFFLFYFLNRDLATRLPAKFQEVLDDLSVRSFTIPDKDYHDRHRFIRMRFVKSITNAWTCRLPMRFDATMGFETLRIASNLFTQSRDRSLKIAFRIFKLENIRVVSKLANSRLWSSSSQSI